MSFTVVLALSTVVGAGLVIGGTCATEVIRLIRTLVHAFGA
ncbi:hypothetical protein [Oleispirillum naphthae]